MIRGHRSGGILAAFAVAALAGCRTVDYTPRIIPITETVIADFANRPTLSFRNVSPAGKVLLADRGWETWNGDYHDWVDVAIAQCRSELGSRGVTVADRAPKTIDLAISRIEIIFGFAAIRSIITLRASTADGRAIEVQGNNWSPATIGRAIDGSLSRAVASLLANAEFRAWVEGA